MKKRIVAIILIILTLLNLSVVYADNTNGEPSIVSEAAVLMDNKTNKILYSKNENTKMYPASTTKILTAILALENCNLDDIITVSYDAVMSIPDGYSTANLQIGEQLTVEQLLQLLLVHSANDAANVLGEKVGGSIDSFVTMMNTKINELGLSSTHFTNTFGMHNQNHYTTAHDLAFIMQYCIKNDAFRKIAGSASCAIPSTNKYGTRLYNSTNELIIPNNKQYYPYLTAGKTGFTTQAGDCLVSCAYKNDLELIGVILGGKTINGISTRFSETKKLYDYGYQQYSIKTIVSKGSVANQIEVKNATKDTKNLDLLINQDISALIKNSDNFDNLIPEISIHSPIQAPIEEGAVLGTARYTIDGIDYEVNLVASHSVEETQILKIALQIGCTIVILLIIYEIFFARRKRKKYSYKR